MYNPIINVLQERQVELPPTALDLSVDLREHGVTQPYIIVMTGRCGSTWLASALSKVPGYANPLEYFTEEGLPYYWKYDGPQSFKDVFLGIASKYSDRGRFGFKINPHRLLWLNHLVDLAKTFPSNNTAWIDMRRLNLVKQALSFVKAKKSGVWHRYKGSSQATSGQDCYDITELDLWREILYIVEAEQLIEKFYNQSNISPLRIWYEEIFDSKSALILRVLKFIDPRIDISNIGNIDLDGDTERLSQGGRIDAELLFISKYCHVLNKIYVNRNSVDVDALRQNLQEIISCHEQHAMP